MFTRPLVPGLALLMALGPTAGATAQDRWHARFEARYGPVRVANLTLHAQDGPETYAVEGRVERTTLVSLIRDFHFDLHVEGQREGDTFRPDRFTGDMNTGHRQVEVAMHYSGGVPVIDRIAPAEPQNDWSLDAANQGGTVDLLTALFRAARPRPRDALCDWSLDLFDGRRRSRLTLGPIEGHRNSLTCAGEYRRLAGYPPEDLASYDHMPFRLTFEPGDAGNWLLTRIDTQTPYGRMRILRLP